MIQSVGENSRRKLSEQAGLRGLVVAGVLLLAAVLGTRPSPLALAGIAAAAGAVALARWPALSLPALVLAALLIKRDLSTGTEVALNVATLLVPALLALWVLTMVIRKRVRLAATKANLPLLLFLVAGIFSLLVGAATWDPAVPRKANLVLVQMSQWAVFAFAAGAFWLTANLGNSRRRLAALTATFLTVAGTVALLRLVPLTQGPTNEIITMAFNRAPLWMLLTAIGGGQLLFNRGLNLPARLFLILTLIASLFYAFALQQDAASNWVGVGAAWAGLLWLRFPRLRWPLVVLLVILTITGLLFPTIYNFAGGDREWQQTGGSRVVLIQRVVEVTMRNPITGLGPAAYRFYAGMKPLPYLRAYWLAPEVNSHNNYIDLFAHGGVVGLALFGWFAVALGVAGVRLRSRYRDGFLAGYLNGALAAGAGALVLMMMADWILPHVYNIGFPGFQASVLVWLFLGGIVALEQPDFATQALPPEDGPGALGDPAT